MAKYAKRGSNRSSKQKPSLVLWFIAFLLLALLLLGLYSLNFFEPAKTHKSKTTTQAAKTAAPNNAPQFDFYTILGGQNQQAQPPVQQPKVKLPPPNIPIPAETKPQAPAVKQVSADTKPVSNNNAPTTTPPAQSKQQYLAPVETAKPLPTKHADQIIKKEAADNKGNENNSIRADKVAYVLQIAAVKHPQDADQLKAQLALLGYDIVVSSTTIKEATWYRVTVGPYRTLAAAQSAQKKLQSYHIKTILHKAK